MTDELLLRRKWTLRAHGQQVVFVKRPVELPQHVLMKAFLWALYLPEYPALSVEIRVGDRYKPDVVAMDGRRPAFWGEAGQVGVTKMRSLAKRYRDTHFAFAKWATKLDTQRSHIAECFQDVERTGPVDVIVFREDSAERFIRDNQIVLSFDDLEWTRIDSRQRGR